MQKGRMQSVEQQLQKSEKDIETLEAEMKTASDSFYKAASEGDKDRWWEKKRLLIQQGGGKAPSGGFTER